MTVITIVCYRSNDIKNRTFVNVTVTIVCFRSNDIKNRTLLHAV